MATLTPKVPDKLHPSHDTRISMDASSYDEICKNCHRTDTLNSWGLLALPCPMVPKSKEENGGNEAKA